jgi:hypothetical protein
MAGEAFDSAEAGSDLVIIRGLTVRPGPRPGLRHRGKSIREIAVALGVAGTKYFSWQGSDTSWGGAGTVVGRQLLIDHTVGFQVPSTSQPGRVRADAEGDRQHGGRNAWARSKDTPFSTAVV